MALMAVQCTMYICGSCPVLIRPGAWNCSPAAMEDSDEGVMVQHNHATNGSLDADLNERMEDERPNHTKIGSLMDDDLKVLSHKNNNCFKTYFMKTLFSFCAPVILRIF